MHSLRQLGNTYRTISTLSSHLCSELSLVTHRPRIAAFRFANHANSWFYHGFGVRWFIDHPKRSHLVHF